MKRLYELLERAFQLAHFIHRDDEVAKRIALEAAKKLEAAMTAQDKRRYYTLLRKLRRKVSLSELAMLQYLVYEASEEYELWREQVGQSSHLGLSQETMIVYFIKHLVKITVHMNSLHVTLGVSRLLHNYATPDASELYSAVLQSPDRVPDDDYFRTRKSELMRKLKKRFGSMISVASGVRGEERFVTHENPERFIALVHECLRQFTPWGTQCVVPENFDARKNSIPELLFNGKDPDEEHPIEANRFHATLDPECFNKLMIGLRREAPDSRLAVPIFKIGQSDDHDSGTGWASKEDGYTAPKLNDADRRSMLDDLKNDAKRRKALTPKSLHVLVDGEERVQMSADRSGQVRFTVGDGCKLIEVQVNDSQGEFLLAVHVLKYETVRHALKPQQVTYAPEGGQRLIFNIIPTGEAEGIVELRYLTSNDSALATLRSWFWPGGEGAWLKPVLTCALLLITAGLLFTRLARKDDTGDVAFTTSSPTPVADVRPLPSPVAQVRPTPSHSVQITPTPIRQVSPPSVKPSPMTRDDVSVIELPAIVLSEEEERTRAELERKGVASLLAVKRLYIDEKGSVKLAKLFGEKLKQQLQSSGEFSFADSPLTGTADGGAVKLTLTPVGQQVRIIVSIVNAGGKVLWPLKPGIRALQYTGSEEKILDKLSRDLISDIQKLKQKK